MILSEVDLRPLRNTSSSPQSIVLSVIMKVLITGGNGFIGRRVTLKLRERGIEVRWASRSTPKTLPQGVDHITLDMAQPTGLLDALSG